MGINLIFVLMLVKVGEAALYCFDDSTADIRVTIDSQASFQIWRLRWRDGEGT